MRIIKIVLVLITCSVYSYANNSMVDIKNKVKEYDSIYNANTQNHYRISARYSINQCIDYLNKLNTTVYPYLSLLEGDKDIKNERQLSLYLHKYLVMQVYESSLKRNLLYGNNSSIDSLDIKQWRSFYDKEIKQFNLRDPKYLVSSAYKDCLGYFIEEDYKNFNESNKEAFLRKVDYIESRFTNPKAKAYALEIHIRENLMHAEPLLIRELINKIDNKYSKEIAIDLKKDLDSTKRFYPGDKVPSLDFKDLLGNKVHLDRYKGKNIILYFWSTTCAPCIKEAPYWNKLVEKYKDNDIVFLAISQDKSKDRLIRYLSNPKNEKKGEVLHLDYPNDPYIVYNTFKIGNAPHFIFINKEGTFVRASAPRPSETSFEELIIDNFIADKDKPKPIVLTNVNLVDIEKGNINRGVNVFLDKGLITRITKNKDISTGYKEVDLQGKYIMPGLIDSHVHFANFIEYGASVDSIAKAYLEQGITTVRDAGGNAEIIKSYNRKISKGLLNAPFAYFSSFWAGEEYFKLLRREASLAYWEQAISNNNRDFESLVKMAKNNGCLGLKLYANLSKVDLVNIVGLCKKYGVRPWGHLAIIPAYPIDVVEAGVETVSHSYLLDEQELEKFDNNIKDSFDNTNIELAKARRVKLFNEMKKRGTLFDVTLVLELKNNMNNVVDYVSEAYSSGVKIVAGTDYLDVNDNGSCNAYLHQELESYVNLCGFSTLDALKSATIMGAEVLGLKDKIGVLKVGAEADILVLDENPLKSLNSLKRINKVILDGKIL